MISRLRRFSAIDLNDPAPAPDPTPTPVTVRWYTGHGSTPWAPGAEPLGRLDQSTARLAKSMGIRQSAGGYFYTADGWRPLAHGWEELAQILPQLPPAPAPAPRPSPLAPPAITRRVELILLAFALALALAFALADAVGAAPAGLTPEQRRAAEVAKGEAPISMVGVEGFVGVLCTMQARLDSPRYPNTLAGVLRAYYAPPKPLTAQEEALAEDVLVYGAECEGGPYFYALSRQDVERNGLRDGDWVTAPLTLPSGAQIGLHFYTSSPWGKQ